MFSATLNKFHARGLIGKRQKGVTMIEYALIAGFISVAVIASLVLIKADLILIWTAISGALGSAT